MRNEQKRLPGFEEPLKLKYPEVPAPVPVPKAKKKKGKQLPLF
jgi:hypothetical protein